MEWGSVLTGLPLLVLGTVIGHRFRRMELLRQDRLQIYGAFLTSLTDLHWEIVRTAEKQQDPEKIVEAGIAILSRIEAHTSQLLLVASTRVLDALKTLNVTMNGDNFVDAVRRVLGDKSDEGALDEMREILRPPMASIANAMRRDLGTRRTPRVADVLAYGAESGGP